MSEENKDKEPSAGDNRVLVYLRVRPPNEEENKWFADGKYKPILRAQDQTPDPEKTIVLAKSNKEHAYDKVFREDSKQDDLFKRAAVPTLENVFDGYCGAVLAYGQTGTGKTFTMQGYAKDYGKKAEGVIPRSAHYIFNRIAKDTANTYKVTLNFVEIYLDRLKDLFQPEAPEVNINHEPERVELLGVTELEVSSEEDFMKLFHQGEKKRVTRATKMNPTSSRGHAALVANVHQVPKDESQGTKIGKLVLVDLAGYERFEQTGVTSGVAAQEAKKINASLLALGGVVNALAEQSKLKHKVHVPYRNAKLTRLLKDCLGGTSKSAIICTIGPCDRYHQETAGTLFFGGRAMDVAVHATTRSVFDPAAYTSSLKTKLDSSIKTIQNMVTWWNRSHPNDFKKYCQKYGEPDCAALEGEEEEELLSALQRNETEASVIATHRQSVSPAAAVAASVVRGSTMLPERTPVNEVEEVRQQWDQEKRLNEEQQNREEHALLQRQWEELEQAKKRGADTGTLANLKKDHAQERQFMQEQRQQMFSHLEEEQQQEEVCALLKAVKTDYDRTTNKEAKRVTELTEHLGATCHNKDEVMNQLFEYIYQLESEVRVNSQNLPAIEQIIKEEAKQQSQQANKAFARQIADLQSANFLLREELQKATGQKLASKSSHGQRQQQAQPAAHGGAHHSPSDHHHRSGYTAEQTAARQHQAELAAAQRAQIEASQRAGQRTGTGGTGAAAPPGAPVPEQAKKRHLFGSRH